MWQALGIALAVVAGGAGLLLFFPPDLCGNTIIAEAISPDGANRAVVFQRNCGATTPFSTQVSLLQRTQRLEGSGNVFTADGNHGRAPARPGGGPEVSVTWINPETLSIRYDARARVFAQEQRVRNVSIVYSTAHP
ncbi:MAG: hypothetical protein M3P51_01250 [Chloroflexota bacterium]|nr:hypothetical protein [Chloroflexota bacterium]